MKKYFKIAIIFIGIILGIIVFDTLQALVFNNNPLIKIRVNKNNTYYVDKGLLINHYYCNNKTKKTVFKWVEYYCPLENTKDISKNNDLDKLNDLINEYLSSNEYLNYAYSYIDGSRIVVGLVENDVEHQKEFLNKIFKQEDITNINDNNLIEFKESKEVFDAEIITVEENYIIVKVLKNSKSFKKDDKVRMSITHPTDGTDDFYVIANKVRITFNGNILFSNPPQISIVDIKLI